MRRDHHRTQRGAGRTGYHPRLYDIDYKKPDPLDYACLDAAVATFRQAGVEAVAVTLVNSYINPDHERAAAYIAERLPAITVIVSVDLLPQLGEHERTITVDLAALAATFHREHQHVFGYAPPHEALKLVYRGGARPAAHA